MLANAIRLALREIASNAMRSALTMLGVIIGVAAVITMVSIGRGATAQVTASIQSLGSNLLIVRPGERFHGFGAAPGAVEPFKLQDVEAIARDVANIADLSAMNSKTARVVYGNHNVTTAIIGADNAYFSIQNWTFAAGRDFSDAEMRGAKPVCVLGSKVRDDLFAAESPLGATLRIGKLSCEVIGVLKAKGQSAFGMNQDDFVVTPLRTFQQRLSGNRDISIIQVSANSTQATTKVRLDIEALLRQRRHVQPGDVDNFQVTDMREIAEAVASTTRVLTALLGAVAAVSLVVGGIGIMNIMLVSVTERIREIGIRLAIGALEGDVLRQFLIEAIVLCLIGGVLGIALGITIARVASGFMNLPFVLDPAIIALAFVFSGLIGVVFGYFPARKAARMNPIEALRHE